MLPDFLIADLTFPEGTVREQLAAAGALVPAALLDASGLADELRECAEDGQHHFWMNTLQDIGVWAEENGRDAELPAEFWVRVAQAAHALELPEFLPYCLGKAHGWPRRDFVDAMAAFATLPEVDGLTGELRAASHRAAELLCDDDPAAAPLVDAGDLEAVAGHLRSGAYDRLGDELSELYSAAFDELFALVTRKGFPADHRACAWAVIGANPFRVVLDEGLVSQTHAEVWWRAA
ncbi:hypothetical protein Arub01_10470 [Actinomadura rubrobrunea]|uniref:Uncharacterized protein n=1 Tax=Actinomadura rubrobrunea TaxID=115335 RepID=A0A9W6PTK4_9ACTN|nr:hypothetical protein [Actinomadura rubrobrunea]GLW62803.1 hypothetical protein Arub01_10470 [Actinomadura rubrobrunea]